MLKLNEFMKLCFSRVSTNTDSLFDVFSRKDCHVLIPAIGIYYFFHFNLSCEADRKAICPPV